MVICIALLIFCIFYLFLYILYMLRATLPNYFVFDPVNFCIFRCLDSFPTCTFLSDFTPFVVLNPFNLHVLHNGALSLLILSRAGNEWRESGCEEKSIKVDPAVHETQGIHKRMISNSMFEISLHIGSIWVFLCA